MEDKIITEKEKSIELVYKYIEDSLQATSDSLRKLELRLTTLVGFSGLLLRFTIDLPQDLVLGSWNIAPGFKIVISLAFALSVILSVWGLLPNPTGKAYTANELLDELEGRDHSNLMLYIALSRDETLQALDKLRLHRAWYLKRATFSIVLGTLLFACEIVLYTAMS